MEEFFGLILIVLAFVFAIWLYIVLPWGMAGRRGRSQVGWLLCSLLLSPLIAIVVLAIIGDARQSA